MIDVHCHFQYKVQEFEQFLRENNAASSASVPDLRSRLGATVAEKYYLMGTNYHDWEDIARLARQYPETVVPGFGIHPWFVTWIIKGASLEKEEEDIRSNSQNQDYSSKKVPSGVIPRGWEGTLVKYLTEFPTAVVGEFGLDRIAVDKSTGVLYDWDLQIEVFKKQYKIAVEHQRAISLHCVRAHQQLYDLLESLQPAAPQSMKSIKRRLKHLNSNPNKSVPDTDKKTEIGTDGSQDCMVLAANIMLHSYSGSADMLSRLLKLAHVGKNIYVSLSKLVNLRSLKKTTLVMPTIPLDRLLIESDLESPTNANECLQDICSFVASSLQISVETAAEVTRNNSVCFLESPSEHPPAS